MLSLILIFTIIIGILYASYVWISKTFPGYEGLFLFYFIVPILVLLTIILIAIMYGKQIEEY